MYPKLTTSAKDSKTLVSKAYNESIQCLASFGEWWHISLPSKMMKLLAKIRSATSVTNCQNKISGPQKLLPINEPLLTDVGLQMRST